MIDVSRPERTEWLDLPDGRRLAWSEWGPPDGRPVLLCAGAAMSGSLGFGVDLLPRSGMRLLGVDRPGLGGSTAHPGRTLASWVDDCAHLVDRRGLTGPVAVGFSQGAPFAVALAGAGLVRALAVVAGQDDLAAQRDLLAPEVAALVDDVRRDPDAVERRFAGLATADGMWELVIGMSAPHDRALYQRDDFAAAYRRCLAEGFRQGAAGYARDLRICLGPWPYPPERVAVPVDLWYGRRDASGVHSPDFGTALARRFPDARHHLLDDEGGSILWTRAGDILTALRERAG
ncbi:alpha/beta fold hydrolase [Micromonospora echinospora]|uniref:alpha/beta fold hydrolase n=1 Tax=Micromonospora echinospora TaxID=1877 RepID=UPI003671BF39